MLTVKGSNHVQTPKYGIYAIDGEYENRAVYKQIWPRKNHNFMYFKNGKYIISDEFGRSEFHHGIEAETSEKCPAWTYSWKSWTGVAFWEQDDYFKINCQNGEV